MEFFENICGKIAGTAIVAVFPALYKKMKQMRFIGLRNLWRRTYTLFKEDPEPLKIELYDKESGYTCFELCYGNSGYRGSYNRLECNHPMCEMHIERSWKELYDISEMCVPRNPTLQRIITITGAHTLYVAVLVPQENQFVKFTLSGRHFLPTKRATWDAAASALKTSPD